MDNLSGNPHINSFGQTRLYGGFFYHPPSYINSTVTLSIECPHKIRPDVFHLVLTRGD